MVRKRNKSKSQQKELPVEKVAVEPPKAKHDPWAAIENDGGEAKTAHQVFYKPKEDEPRVVINDKRKKRKPARSDGSEAVLIPAHPRNPPSKRNLGDGDARDEAATNGVAESAKRARIEPCDGELPTNIFASMIKKSNEDGNKKNKKGNKVTSSSVSVEDDEVIHVDIRPKEVVKTKTKSSAIAEEVVCEEPIRQDKNSKKSFPKKSLRLADLSADGDMDGLDSDDNEEFDDINDYDGLMNAVFGDSDSENEDEMEDEEVEIDEDEEECDGEMEEDEIDADDMVVRPEDVEAVVAGESDNEDEELSDEDEIEDEMEGEEIEDEMEDEDEHDHEGGCCGGHDQESDVGDEEQDSDSDVSEQDAESDGEGNLGELRTAGRISTTRKSSSRPPVDFDVFPFNDDDSTVSATRAFSWMITPCDTQTFFNDFFQSNCLVVKRSSAINYYGNLFSTERFVQLLENNYVEYGANINIAEYKHSVRKTMNGVGRVYPHHINKHLKAGRSVQLVNPQTFDDHIWQLCELIQELFGCFVGANTYLTPAGSAGFAPHWDEIDAFLLQLEGKKYWKVYAPRDNDEELPRDSSGNFTDEDMKGRKPTFEGWVEAGDLLYIPRGFIHQASTSKDVHSLHVTISTGRQWAYADLMEKLLPEAIQALASSRLKMRRSLPIGMLDMGGVANVQYAMEDNFEERFKVPLDRHMSMLRNFVADHCMDSGVDVMVKEFMKTALPPLVTPEERRLSVMGSSVDVLTGNPTQFNPSTEVKFIRRHGQRLIFASEDSAFIAHRMNNSRLYEGRPEETIDIPVEWSEGFTQLMDSYPEWIRVEEMTSEMDKAEHQELLTLLYENGLLMVRKGKITKSAKKAKALAAAKNKK